MIRIAQLADSHLDELHDLEENVRVHRAAIEQIGAAEPDLILHPGDLHNRRSSPEVRNAAAEILTRLAEIAPVILVRGNHDVPGDLQIYGRLETQYGLRVFDRICTVHTAELGVQVLPWFDRRWFVDQGGDSTQQAIVCARRLLDNMRIEAEQTVARGGIVIGVGHVMIGGARVSPGQMLIGQGVELAPSDLLASGAAFWALGHIHKHQSFLQDRVVYSGSPQRHDFGETEAKGWVLWQLEPDREFPGGARVDWSWHELPATQLELIDLDWTTPAAVEALRRGELPGLPDVVDAQWRVRLRYRIEAEHRDLVSEERLRKALTCAQLKIEPNVQHRARARSAAIVDARSTWDELLAFWAAKGREFPPDRLDRLRSRFAPIEQEAAG